MTRVWEGVSPSPRERITDATPGSTWSEPPTRPSSPWSAGYKLGGWMSRVHPCVPAGCLEPVSVAPSPYIAIPYIADYRNESGTVIYSCPAITGIMASVTEQIVTCTRRPTHYEFLPITLHDCVGCTGDDSSALVTRTVSEDFRNASGSVIFTWPYLMATTDGKTHQVITCSEKPSRSSQTPGARQHRYQPPRDTKEDASCPDACRSRRRLRGCKDEHVAEKDLDEICEDVWTRTPTS
ncbi:uncharacterized protein LOC119581752 [Penaeus monodon]|uniref:uncharacterized protein LOC119581752 n=1 Tax=Penaeus monodon TaxID=6687 RepID=UPI0018A72CFA|nr:uncharacterized protein LOC119581752 [Penaeus monodon]